MATASYNLRPLLLEEQQAADGGFTHIATVSANDLTTAATNTAQTLTLGTVPKGWIVNKTLIRLAKPFQATSDPTAYNTTTVVVGDAGSSNRYVASAQLNVNGTPITIPVYNNTAYQVTSDTPVLAAFGSQSGKAVNSLNVGQVDILFQLIDTKVISDLLGSGIITK